MDGEFLGSILQQIEELQSIHEKEIKTLRQVNTIVESCLLTVK